MDNDESNVSETELSNQYDSLTFDNKQVLSDPESNSDKQLGSSQQSTLVYQTVNDCFEDESLFSLLYNDVQSRLAISILIRLSNAYVM